MKTWTAFFATLLLFATTASAVDTVAITEFFEKPIGEKASRQWIELFNYSSQPVEMRGWRLSGGGNNLVDIPKTTIPGGGYMIILCGGRAALPIDAAKRVFETEWLGGRSESRIIQIDQGDFHIGGEITLLNRQRQTVWSLFLRGDGKEGRATFYADHRFRLINKFGAKGEPGVVRDGNDAGIQGGEFLGYEGNWVRQDPVAYDSDVSGLQTGFDDLYGPDAPRGHAKPGNGSPLKGDYKVIGAK